jgi:hypothetical protein
MDISQGNFCARIYGEKAGDQMEQTLTVRTPHCGHAVWGTFLGLEGSSAANIGTSARTLSHFSSHLADEASSSTLFLAVQVHPAATLAVQIQQIPAFVSTCPHKNH